MIINKKYTMASLKLKIVIEIIEITAMTSAIIGKVGYAGTLKGLANPGSFFLSCNKAIIEIIYKVNAPNTDMVMISEVLPVSKAMMPMAIFTNNALAGVRNLEWM